MHTQKVIDEDIFSSSSSLEYQETALPPQINYEILSSIILLGYFALMSIWIYIRFRGTEEAPKITKHGVEGVLESLDYERKVEKHVEYPEFVECSVRTRQVRRFAIWFVFISLILSLLGQLNHKNFLVNPHPLISSSLLLFAWSLTTIVYAGELRGYGRSQSLVPGFWILAALLDMGTLGLMSSNIKGDAVNFAFFLLRFLGELVLSGSLNARRTDGYTALEDATPKEKDAWSQLPKLLPFLWPSTDPKLQMYVFAAFAMLVLGRFVNVILPLAYKKVVDALTADPGAKIPFPWLAILIFVGARVLQGGSSGILSNLESLFWISPSQYSTRKIQTAVFKHLMNLSMEWHLNRKTGEVMQITSRGSSSIASLLESIFFFILPVLVDILIAVGVLVILFDWMFGLITFVTIFAYVGTTVVITEWRTKFRRRGNDLDNQVKAKITDALLNYETCKVFSAEQFEEDKYTDAILQYQAADWTTQSSLSLLNMSQGICINLGLLVGSLLSAYQVSKGEKTVGDFVLFQAYINQLYAPLNWLGTYYRMIQGNLVDFEQLFNLLREPVTITDEPDAKDLSLTSGRLEFRNVSFTYGKGHNVLKNVSFTVEPGQTVALVGPTGSGKSTCTRLLFRFYDPTDGEILIDGQDIRKVTQSSLRKLIGLVPQDTGLFNTTIKENIRYGKFSTTDDEIVEAARNAELLSSIESFPDKFDTMVGERGLKLSGGQKQRCSLARIFLKNPPILVLDEATSSLDQVTEKKVSDTLYRLSTGRTTLVVAHRLQSIIHSDKIIVLADGKITDQGTHDELLSLGKDRISQGLDPGIYYNLWTAQEAKDEVDV